jgi:SnoaL-like domain
MSRLGPWKPTSIDERLDRMESLAAIQQLPPRYAVALDSRDMDALVSLFVPDVRVGGAEVGRDALKRWFTHTMSQMRTSVHLVADHVVDFDDADHARGIVYCRDELEQPSTGDWEIGVLQYWDSYVRVDGEWCFSRRKFLRWYIVDALTRPSHGAGVNTGTDALSTHQLPEAYESWGRFWTAIGAGPGRSSG